LHVYSTNGISIGSADFVGPRLSPTDTYTGRQTHRLTDRLTDRQTDRQTNRQTDTHTQTHRQTERHTDHASSVAIGRIYALHACDAANKQDLSKKFGNRPDQKGRIFHWGKLTVTPASRKHCIRQPAFHLGADRLSCSTKLISLDFSISRHRFSLKVRLLEEYLDSCIKQGAFDPFDFIPETACRRSVQPILQSSRP